MCRLRPRCNMPYCCRCTSPGNLLALRRFVSSGLLARGSGVLHLRRARLSCAHPRRTSLCSLGLGGMGLCRAFALGRPLCCGAARLGLPCRCLRTSTGLLCRPRLRLRLRLRGCLLLVTGSCQCALPVSLPRRLALVRGRLLLATGARGELLLPRRFGTMLTLRGLGLLLTALRGDGAHTLLALHHRLVLAIGYNVIARHLLLLLLRQVRPLPQQLLAILGGDRLLLALRHCLLPPLRCNLLQPRSLHLLGTPLGVAIGRVECRGRAAAAATVPIRISNRGPLSQLLLATPMRRLALGGSAPRSIVRRGDVAPTQQGAALNRPLCCRNAAVTISPRCLAQIVSATIISRRILTGAPFVAAVANGATVGIIDDYQIAARISVSVLRPLDVVRIVGAWLIIVIAIAVIDRLGDRFVAIVGLPSPRLHPVSIIESVIRGRFTDHGVERIGAIDICIRISAIRGRRYRNGRRSGQVSSRRRGGYRARRCVGQRHGRGKRRQHICAACRRH